MHLSFTAIKNLGFLLMFLVCVSVLIISDWQYAHLISDLERLGPAIKDSFLRNGAMYHYGFRFLASALVIVTFLVLYALSRGISYPVKKLALAAEEFSKGNLDHRVSLKNKDEFGVLANALNQMAQKIDESNRLQRRLLQAEKLQTIGQLTSAISHDFRNILTCIVIGVDQLGSELAGQNVSSKHFKTIKDSTERAIKLSNQILAYSRNEETATQDIDLNEVLASLEPMFLLALGKQIKLTINKSDDGAHIIASRSHVEQIIMNLVLNARDAMPNGGNILIDIKEVTNNEGRKSIMLRVKDTGKGIDNQNIKNIFEPFFTTKGAENGTGLGLFTVKGLVETYKGQINVESEPGNYTEFCVTAPAASSSNEQSRDCLS